VAAPTPMPLRIERRFTRKSRIAIYLPCDSEIRS
jgi:hypothetical protein